MITPDDIRVEGSSYLQSLTKLIGKKISDIHGYIADEVGGGAVFKPTQLIFEDGTKLGFEGEHDFPYLVDYGDPQPHYDQETLDRLYDEGN